MSAVKRFGKYTLWALTGLFCALALLIATFLFYSPSRLWLANEVLNKINGEDLKIEITQLAWPTLGKLYLDHIQVHKGEALWMDGKAISIEWQPSALWHKNVIVELFSAQAFKYVHVPSEQAVDSPEKANEFVLPDWRINIQQAKVNSLTIDMAKPNWPLLEYSVEADAKLFYTEAPFFINLNALSLRDKKSNINIATTVFEKGNTHFEGQLYEPANGPLGNLLQLPKQQSIDAEFKLDLNTQQAPWQIGIETFAIPFLNHSIKASGTANIGIENSTFNIPELILFVDDQKQRLRAGGDKTNLWLDAQFVNVPLDLVQPWLDEPISGKVSAQLEGSWVFATQRLPKLDFKVNTDLKVREQKLVAQTQGQILDDVISFKPSELSLDSTKVQFEGALAPFDQRNNFNAKIQKFSTELLKPWPIEIPDNIYASAEHTELTITGELSSPTIAAKTKALIRRNDLEFDLDLDAKASQTQAAMQHLAINYQEQKIALQGDLNWQDKTAQLSFDIQQLNDSLIKTIGSEFEVELPEELSALINGTGVVSGPWLKPAVEADLKIAGNYTLEDKVIPYLLVVDGKGQASSLKDYSLNINNIDLALNQSSVFNLNGRADAEKMQLSLNINRLPTQVLTALGWHSAIGEAEGKIRIQGTQELPLLSGELSYRNGKEDFAAATDFDTVKGNLQAHVSFMQNNSEVGYYNLALPLHQYTQNTPKNIADLPINIHGNGKLNLEILEIFLNPDVHELRGLVDTEIHITGTTEQPKINGYVKSQNISYQNFLTNTHFKTITIDLAANNDALTLRSLNAIDSEGGKLDVQGTVLLAPELFKDERMIKLEVKARNASLLTTDMFNGQVDGNISVYGHLQEIWVKGKGNISPMNVNIDQNFKKSIPTIKYTEIKETEEKPNNFPVVNIDILLTVDHKGYVRGRGLHTEIGGQLALTGTLEELSYRGRFDTQRGRLEAFGKKFVLQNGTVQVSNNVVSMYVVAEHHSPNYLYTVELSGTQDEPKVSLRSSPAMPEDEILARLIFGKSVHDITPFQAIQLATAIQSMANGSTFDPLESTRQLLGVDSLTIDSEETENGDNGISLGVGKYLNEKVYVEVKHTPDPKQPWQGNVEVELTPNINLQSSTSETGGARGEIIWKMDY